MPLDGRPDNGDDDGDSYLPGFPCIVVGGCANGLFLPSIDIDAERIELSRPAYIKPLASAVQQVPEIANESDEYILHPIGLNDGPGAVGVMGIAVVAGRSLPWAWKQIVAGFAQNAVNELRAAGINPPSN